MKTVADSERRRWILEIAIFQWCVLSPKKGTAVAGATAGVYKTFLSGATRFLLVTKEMGLYLYENGRTLSCLKQKKRSFSGNAFLLYRLIKNFSVFLIKFLKSSVFDFLTDLRHHFIIEPKIMKNAKAHSKALVRF